MSTVAVLANVNVSFTGCAASQLLFLRVWSAVCPFLSTLEKKNTCPVDWKMAQLVNVNSLQDTLLVSLNFFLF